MRKGQFEKELQEEMDLMLLKGESDVSSESVEANGKSVAS